MEHLPAVGAHYADGIEGKCVMIVGNSHWSDDLDGDHDGITKEVVDNVISGKYNIAFFNQIRDYFGFTSHSSFWSQVAFLNYAPRTIGSGDERFNKLTMEMADEAKVRLAKVVEELNPDMVLIFSTSIRWALPKMVLADANLPLKAAKVGGMPGKPGTRVYLLRHTQGAQKQQMTETVQAILEL